MVNIRVKKLHPDAIIPSYAHPGYAGLDFYSLEETVIPAGERKGIHTGISLELPHGYVSLFWDKSGLALKSGITILGGVIDAGYRGEYVVIMYNTSREDFRVSKGQKIAQLLIQPVENATLEEVSDLNDSSRGEGAFGSTGK